MHITDIKVNDDHKSAIFELDKVDILRAFHSMKPHSFVLQ